MVAPIFCTPVFCLSLRSQMRGNNSVIVCENSLEMLEWDLEFIANAKESIEFSPNFTGGDVFQKIMHAFEKKMQQCPDIQIYMLAAPPLLEKADVEMIARFKKEYPCNFHFQYTESIFAPLPDYLTFDNHVKCLIVDEHYYSVGGTNFDEFQCVEGTQAPSRRAAEIFARKNIPGAMRDQDIVGRGSLAVPLREMFYKLFALWDQYMTTFQLIKDPDYFTNTAYKTLSGPKPYVSRFETSYALRAVPSIKMLTSVPMEAMNAITDEYVDLINKAQEKIVIANLYLNPHETIFEALLNAANRGVRIEIITNGYWDFSPNFGALLGWANRSNYVPFYYGRTFHFWQQSDVAATPLKNTQIFEFQVPDTFLHKKVMIVDNRYSVVGSYNLGKRSHYGDYELNVMIDSAQVATDFIKVIERDKTFSHEVKLDDAIRWYFDPAISYFASVQKLLHGFM